MQDRRPGRLSGLGRARIGATGCECRCGGEEDDCGAARLPFARRQRLADLHERHRPTDQRSRGASAPCLPVLVATRVDGRRCCAKRAAAGGGPLRLEPSTAAHAVRAAHRAAVAAGGRDSVTPWCDPSGLVSPASWTTTPNPGALILK